MAEVFQREPKSDAYLIVEDDALFCRNVRQLLEQVLWPSPATAAVSLYCSQAFQQEQPGFHQVDRGWDFIGSVALVFPNASLGALLTNKRIVTHRRDGPYDGFRNADSVIGRWAREAEWPLYVCSPSLVQHIGHCSTIGAHGVYGIRSAADFVGETFDARTLSSELTDRTSDWQ